MRLESILTRAILGMAVADAFLNPVSPTSSSSITRLSAKKKAAPAAAKKIQVKLLKHVAGTGNAGDIIMVTPPFYNNKLRPTKLAELISDEQVELERSEAASAAAEREAKAKALKELIERTPLVLKRKAGPEGHLFGGINAKVIIEELKGSTGEADFLSSKGVKVTALLDGEGKKMRGDIKELGSFQATLALTKEVSAKVELEVKSEE
jgi:large subunit ribosomal protein L9